MPNPKHSVESFQAILDDTHPGHFQVLEYTGYKDPGLFRCLKCATEFRQTPSKVKARGNCPGCGRKTGDHRKRVGLEKAEKAAKDSGLELVAASKALKHHANQSARYSFRCPIHGVFTTPRMRGGVKCPKCHPPTFFAPTHPDAIPKRLRGKACLLYLIVIRDSSGVWTKIGISTNWESRQRHMKKEGVEVLHTLRTYKTNLYDATRIEWELKKRMRKILGKRACPRVKWSGWSECFRDPFRQCPAIFDRAVREFR